MSDTLISVGEVFRLSYKESETGAAGPRLPSYLDLTRGRHPKAVNPNRGIWPYPEVQETSGGPKRIPAIVCTSNPFSPNARNNPWIDIIEPDEGYALYNGDNKSSKTQPFHTPGNHAVWSVFPLYIERAQRVLAPPFVLFRQVQVARSRSGFKEFCGYGVPTRLTLRTQREPRKASYFVNLAVELALFELSDSGGRLNWRWIDDRRDPSITAEDALAAAPPAWKRWVHGEDVDRCRRRVVRERIIPRVTQTVSDEPDISILRKIHDHYQTRRTEFEGLAARIAARVIGERCQRKWVTRASRDGGYDFVCLLEVGEPKSRTAVVVLGQAKCVAPSRSIGPEDLARLVARLRRGWIGAFVTTGTFTDQAQEEVLVDNYPLLLISGLTVAQEVRKILSEGVTLEELFRAETEWYNSNVRPWHPARAMEELNSGVEVPAPLVGGSGVGPYSTSRRNH